MRLGIFFRERLSGVPDVIEELEAWASRINSTWRENHRDNGTHRSGLTIANDATSTVLATSARVFVGTGSPEGVQTADVGGLYLNTSGGASTVLYVKESGNGLATGWVAK